MTHVGKKYAEAASKANQLRRTSFRVIFFEFNMARK